MIELLDSASRARLLEPMPEGTRFVLRRAPEDRYPDDPYVLLLSVSPEDDRLEAVRRGNYAWALRTAQHLHIPDDRIQHTYGADDRDDGYEGWHLNAHILRGA